MMHQWKYLPRDSVGEVQVEDGREEVHVRTPVQDRLVRPLVEKAFEKLFEPVKERVLTYFERYGNVKEVHPSSQRIVQGRLKRLEELLIREFRELAWVAAGFEGKIEETKFKEDDLREQLRIVYGRLEEEQRKSEKLEKQVKHLVEETEALKMKYKKTLENLKVSYVTKVDDTTNECKSILEMRQNQILEALVNEFKTRLKSETFALKRSYEDAQRRIRETVEMETASEKEEFRQAVNREFQTRLANFKRQYLVQHNKQVARFRQEIRRLEDRLAESHLLMVTKASSKKI